MFLSDKIVSTLSIFDFVFFRCDKCSFVYAVDTDALHDHTRRQNNIHCPACVKTEYCNKLEG